MLAKKGLQRKIDDRQTVDRLIDRLDRVQTDRQGPDRDRDRHRQTDRQTDRQTLVVPVALLIAVFLLFFHR